MNFDLFVPVPSAFAFEDDPITFTRFILDTVAQTCGYEIQNEPSLK